jgi:hypothetical protein
MHINLDMAIHLHAFVGRGIVGRGIVAHQTKMCTSYRRNINDMHINLDMAIYLHYPLEEAYNKPTCSVDNNNT